MADNDIENNSIDFLTQFLEEEAQDDIPTFSRKKTTKSDLPSAKDVLVALALNRQVSEETRQKILDGAVRTIVAGVPDGGWAAPVADALAEFVGERMHRVVREKTPLPRDLEDHRLPGLAHAGEYIVGVAPDPDRSLPPLLLSIAQLRLAVLPPDAAMIMEVLRHCQEGPVPPETTGLKPQVLSFDELCSLIPHGGKAVETVERIRAAIERKLGSGIGRKRKTIPKLEDAVEYGDARTWALSLRDDIVDLRAGLIDWEDIDRGAVFYGPPGTGKTLLATMLGESLAIPTVVSSIGELFASSSGYLDGVIKSLRKVFDEARAKSPSILFLDEINALPNIDTVGDRNRDYWTPVILDFYQLLDGAMSDRAGVIVIGATNRIEDIHPALLRPGRLERAIYVGPPDEHGIERIMRHHLAGELADADLRMLAKLQVVRRTTGAVIDEQVRAARRRARRAKRPMTLEDIEAQIITEEDRDETTLRRAAVHEAGHAIGGIVNGEMLEMISVVQVGDAGGGTMFTNPDRKLATRSDFEAMVVRMLSARAAEESILGEPSQGAGGAEDSDIGHATRIASMVEGTWGLGSSLVYRAAPDDVVGLLKDPLFRAKVDALLRELYERALNLARKHQSEILVVADALMERKFLTGDEVHAILDRHHESVSTHSSPDAIAAE